MKILLACLLLIVSDQAWSDPVKILIIPFDNATDNKKNQPLATGIVDILTVCFSSDAEKIIVLDRSSLDASLDEQSLSWTKFVDNNNYQSIGQGLGVDFILRGSMFKQDNQMHTQALLFDVATTELRHSVSSAININNVVNSLCTKIASPLVPLLNKKNAAPKDFTTEQIPEKRQLLIEGLNHYYNGNYAQSLAPFLKLVTTYPDDATSHYWLAQSFYSAGQDDFAKIQLQDFISRFNDSSRIIKVQLLLKNLDSKRLRNEQRNENQ